MYRFYRLSFLAGVLFFCQTSWLHAQGSKQASPPPGKPSLIRINPQKQLLGGAKSSQKVLEDHLHLGTHDKLLKSSASSDQLGYAHEKYQQYYKGIKVEHGIYAVHTKNSVVESISGEFYTIPDVSTAPTLSEPEALQRALRFTGATKYMWEVAAEEKGIKSAQKDQQATYLPKAELLICPKYLQQKAGAAAEMALAYKFDIYAQEPLSRAYIYVDAHTGEIILKDAIIKHVDAPAATRYSGTRTIQTQAVSGGGYQLKHVTGGVSIETYNMNVGTTYELATKFIDADNNWTSGEYNNLNKDNAALDAHWGSVKTYEYFFTKHGRNSFDNQGGAIRSYIHYGQSYDNAFWDGSKMTYGDGGTKFNPLTSIDITGHEIGHGVCSYTAGLIYLNESGALNESFSDIWGASVEQFAAPEKSTWLIGEEVMKQAGAMRSMSNPNAKGQPDTYLGSYWYTGNQDNGGVHINSGVMNFWYYLLADPTSKSGTNDHGYAYSVTGIGIDKAAKIAYRAESMYLTANSQYINAREFTIQAATDLYGAGSNEVTQTKNAWNAVGVYEAIAAPSNLTATAASATSVNLSWQDNMTDETGFKIERSLASGSGFVLVATVAPNVTTYSNSSLPANTAYYYRVKAIKNSSWSPNSNEAKVILGTPPATSGGVPIAEYQALVDLYNSTAGPNWTNKTNWLVGNVNTWIGVSVANGRVVGINLPMNNLDGYLPASLGDLSALLSFTVFENKLKGNIPASLGKLAALQKLWLMNNQLSGTIPIELGNLSNLKYLYIFNNQLTGTIPVELGNLSVSVFEQLSLAGNQLTGSIPTSLGKLLALKILSLDVNQLSGTVPSSLGNLSNLTYLALANNQLIGSLPASLGNLPVLESIYLDNNQFTSIPTFIANPTFFWTQNNRLTFESLEPNIDKFSSEIDYAPQDSVLSSAKVGLVAGQSLTLSSLVGGSINLNLYQWTKDGVDIVGATSPTLSVNATGWYGCRITNTLVTGLTLHRRRVKVTVVPLSSCIPQSDLLALVDFYNTTNGSNWTNNANWLTGLVSTWKGVIVTGCRVTSLNLYNNNLVGYLPSSLGTLSALQGLNLWSNKLSGSIPTSLGSLSALKNLYLFNNQLIGTIPVELGNLSVSAFEGLNLAGNQLTGSIPSSLGNLLALKMLGLDVNQLSGTVPSSLANLTNLTFLALANNQLIGSLPAGIGNLPALEEIDLNNNQFTSIPAFVAYPTVQFLTHNNQLTFESLEPNIDKFFSETHYAPQDSVLLAAKLGLVAGQSLTLSASVGGNNNLYQWTKNGVDVAGATNSTLTVTATGWYGCRITNTLVTGLTLHRRRVGVKQNQAITFAAIPAKTYGTPAFTLGATASSGLPVTYTSSNTAVATISGNTVTLLSVGSAVITASQVGNPTYHSAPAVAQTLTVTQAPSPALTSPVSGATNVAVAVTVYCNGIPNATSYTFELNPNAAFNTATALTLTASTSNVTFSGLQYNTTYYARAKTNLSTTWGVTKSFTTQLAPGGRIVATDFTPTAKINVYPNPFSDEIRVLIESDDDVPLHFTLTDMQGKVLYQSSLHTTNQETHLGSGLSNGVYLLHARWGNRTQVFKIVKN